jgi:membrane-associated protease RseP (regulator of RpoE activity)
MIIVGGSLCLLAWLLGRFLARKFFGVEGAPLLSRQEDPRYGSLPLARRVMFRMAGPVAVYLLASALGFAALRATGERVTTMIVDVMAGGPAEAAGMRSGDRIVTIDGKPPAVWDDVLARVRAVGAGRPLTFQVQRDDGEHTLSVAPDAEGRIRILSRLKKVDAPLATSLAQAVAWPITTVARTIRTAVLMATGKESVALQGPVAIVREVASSGDDGGHPRAAMVLLLLASSAGLVWPLGLMLELVFAPRKRRALQ